MHTVASATHTALQAGGPPYRVYPSRWGDLALAARPYDQRESAAHMLYSMGALAAEVTRSATPRGGWRAGMRGMVRAAHTAAQNLVLAGRENPIHLNTWVNVV